MKKLLYYSFMAFPFLAVSQNDILPYAFVNQSNIKVSLYSTSLCIEEKNSFFQDTIFENYFSLELMKESLSAFEVKVNSVSQFNSPTITGWIEKKYCSVFLSKNKKIKLFSQPSPESSFELIEFEDDMMVNVVNISPFKDKFIKIVFIKDDEYFTGWVIDYCGNIYNSCG